MERVRRVLDPAGALFSRELQLSDGAASTALADFLQASGPVQDARCSRAGQSGWSSTELLHAQRSCLCPASLLAVQPILTLNTPALILPTSCPPRWLQEAVQAARKHHDVKSLPAQYLSEEAMVFLNIPMDAETPTMRLLRPQVGLPGGLGWGQSRASLPHGMQRWAAFAWSMLGRCKHEG